MSVADRLRPPHVVMRMNRMGSAHPTRLSFMRALLRRLKREDWRFDRPVFDIDANGVGRAVYRAIGPRRTYSLVAFAHDLPPEKRSDRVIAEAWDSTFTLFDGTPTPADLDRLQANVPLQEAGRVSDSELSLSRANRSARLWEHVVSRLAAGEQPDADALAATGYLMRTTAVYGSGKFGAADRAVLADRPLMGGPFRAEMLAVWLIRTFTMDLVEHMAQVKGGDRAVRLAPDLRRLLGVGNSTGLGMAPFLVTHPALLHAWVNARETALARVRALPESDAKTRLGYAAALATAQDNAAAWASDHPIQQTKLTHLRADLQAIADHGVPKGPAPWDALWRWGETALSPEGQEALLSLMLEPHGPLIDDLADAMGADEQAMFAIDGAATVAQTRAQVDAVYGWAREIDFDAPDACARFWYVSEEKLEPRLGERHTEPGADREQPLDAARAAIMLRRALDAWPDDALLADVLLARPDCRAAARRIQTVAARPYAEIQDNLISGETLPINMLRLKLAFFGATRFDPRSDRWVRICMYAGAPYPEDLTADASVWVA